MSMVSNLLKASLVTATLLLAGAAHAGDVTSDRAQAAANAKPAGTETRPTSGSPKPAEAKACHCAAAAPKSDAEQSGPYDPDFMGGYQPG